MSKKLLGTLALALWCATVGIGKAESVLSFSDTATFDKEGHNYNKKYSVVLWFRIYNDLNGVIPGTWREYFQPYAKERVLFITFIPISGKEYTVWINEGFE